MKNLLQIIFGKKLTDTRGKTGISASREVLPSPIREVSRPITDSLCCPYCSSKDFFRRGYRQKVLERVQLYQCNSCHKTFTPQSVHGKHYPLATIFDAISLYNLGYSLEESCRRINEKRAPVSESSLIVGSGIPMSDTRKLNISHLEKDVKSTSMAGQSNVPAASDAAEGGGHDPQPLRTEMCIGHSPLLADSPSNHENSILQKSFMIQPSTLSAWLSQFKENLPFLRMRDFATAKYKPQDMVITATLAHRQLYRYRFHRAKCAMIMQENFHHRIYAPLVEFLEMVPGECPHQYYQDGLRASEAPLTFSKIAMIVRGKQNFATQLATFVVQGAKERNNRHDILQKFMLYNDSVTVATEVPVYITRDDIEHMKTQLGFEIYNRVVASNSLSFRASACHCERSEANSTGGFREIASSSTTAVGTPRKDNHNPAAEIDRDLSAKSLPKTSATTAEVDIAEVALNDLPKLITGHIDILQIRNGQVHLLDYKPNAEKERPIEQLTLYAMALSRLTGLRLFEFKCAWFDEKDYFEFYPLHVLHKPKKARRRRTVATMEGTYQINRLVSKIKTIYPTPYV